MTDSKHSRGVISELTAAEYYASKGYTIFWPMLTQSTIDFIAVYKELCTKVQVKTATWSKSGDNSYLQARLVGRNKYRKEYTEEDCDEFCFVDPTTDRIWVCNFSELKGHTSVCLDRKEYKSTRGKSYDPSQWLVKH